MEGEEPMISVRVAGAWTGILSISTSWSASQLRAEASRCSGFDPQTINLIAAGKNLKDSDTLSALRPNSKLLMTRVGIQLATPLMQEAERADRLERIRAAAEAMSSRGDGQYLSLDQYDVILQNQNGEPLSFDTESSRKGVLMGLLMYSQARKLIQERKYQDALEILKFAEESLSFCDKQLLEHVDNVLFLQIDMVWCSFMLRDIGSLGAAKERLTKARSGLKRVHGQNLERLRVLQGGFNSGLAIYVRLELLEGVVAYHSGLTPEARESLLAAQAKFKQLQVSDESLALLAGLGFTAKESLRALRVTGQNVDQAVSFVMEQRDLKEKRRKEDQKHHKERKEQSRYGKTKSGKAVDLRQLNALVSLGYEKPLVVEALKQSDNDTNVALDVLSNPECLEALQISLASSSKRSRHTVSEDDLNKLVQMGFARERAVRALESSRSFEEALEKLFSDSNASSSSNPEPEPESNPEQAVEPEAVANEADVLREAEEDLAQNVTGDAYEEYDIEVDLEGEAIAEYLKMLEVK